VGLVVVLGPRSRAHRALDEVLLRPHPSTPAVAGVVLLTALVGSMALAERPPRALEMTLLPVGAGQCAVIRAPSGASLMVDCAGVRTVTREEEKTIRRFLERRYDLAPEARRRLATRLADALRTRFPGLDPSRLPNPEAFLEVVVRSIHERRR
jgi:hypothetical protein